MIYIYFVVFESRKNLLTLASNKNEKGVTLLLSKLLFSLLLLTDIFIFFHRNIFLFHSDLFNSYQLNVFCHLNLYLFEYLVVFISSIYIVFFYIYK